MGQQTFCKGSDSTLGLVNQEANWEYINTYLTGEETNLHKININEIQNIIKCL